MNRRLAATLLALSCASPRETMKNEPPVTEKKPEPAAADSKPAEAPKPKGPQLPETRTQLIEDILFGTKVKDPFRWLEDEKASEVQEWMRAQDAVARAKLHELPHRDELIKRFHDLFYIDAVSAPIKRGGRYFYTRRLKTQEKAIVYWRANERAPEKVLLDPNLWSTDNTVSLGTWAPSWDGKKVVFAEKPNAADEATLYVLDVDSGERSKVDVIPGAKYASPSWTPDSKAFYYEWLPVDPKIPVSERPGYCELRLHVLGADPAKDEIVRPKTSDPKTFLGGGISRDGHWLFSYVVRGWNENDVFFKRVGKDKEWKTLALGKDAKYAVDAWRDVFYVTTDEGAPNKRVFKVDPGKPDRKDWKELIAERKDAALESVTIVGGALAISSLKYAASEIELYNLADGKLLRRIELPGQGTSSNLIGLEDDDEAYYAYSSFLTTPQVFKTSVKTGKSTEWAKVEVPVDPKPYEVRQVFYPSKDGTQISMWVVLKKGLERNGTAPTLLYGYGGFDISLTSSFAASIFPWLEAGGIYAVPNLRGGGEYGKRWHDAGKQANKQNVFDDFVAAAEFLIREKYTSPKKLAIRGGSNGGLLVGAAMTQRPELFGAVICAVPLLDMLRYHQFGSGKTWIPEYGDPEKADDFAVLEAYSPYHHVSKGVVYPQLLMMSADHDDRVDPMHARKFIARVQAVLPQREAALLRIEMNSGHGGSDQVKKTVEASGDWVAFLLHALEVKVPPAAAAPQGTLSLPRNASPDGGQ
ncbi:MAG: S9 family peptidase [Myxococcaceae bacterium]|nr:S9 family peptidase [Myxococcaceae bacterium]